MIKISTYYFFFWGGGNLNKADVNKSRLYWIFIWIFKQCIFIYLDYISINECIIGILCLQPSLNIIMNMRQ